MTYSLINQQVYDGSPCGACGRDHAGSQSETIDRLVKPRGCGCSCHNLHIQHALSFLRIFAPKEKYAITDNVSFAERADAYVAGEGKRLDAYLKGEGRSAYELAGVGTTDLEGAVAAALITDDKAYILGDNDFDRKVGELALRYGVPKEWAQRYVFDHENTHRWQKGMAFQTEKDAERDVEKTLFAYYKKLGGENDGDAEMYDALAGLAGDRFASVDVNYAEPKEHAHIGESIAA